MRRGCPAARSSVQCAAGGEAGPPVLHGAPADELTDPIRCTSWLSMVTEKAELTKRAPGQGWARGRV